MVIYMAPKTQAFSKRRQMGLCQIKTTGCTAKETTNMVKDNLCNDNIEIIHWIKSWYTEYTISSKSLTEKKIKNDQQTRIEISGKNTNDLQINEKWSSSLTIRELYAKPTMRSHLTLVRMCVMKKICDYRCWGGMRRGTWHSLGPPRKRKSLHKEWSRPVSLSGKLYFD